MNPSLLARLCLVGLTLASGFARASDVIGATGHDSDSIGGQKILVVLLEPSNGDKSLFTFNKIKNPTVANKQALMPALREAVQYIFAGEKDSDDKRSMDQYWRVASRGRTWLDELEVLMPRTEDAIRCDQYDDILPRALEKARAIQGPQALAQWSQIVVVSPCKDSVFTSTSGLMAQAQLQKFLGNGAVAPTFKASVVTLANAALNSLAGNPDHWRRYLVHEMGHGMGLKHSSAIYARAGVLDGGTNPQRHFHYGDILTPMGHGGANFFPFPQLRHLGWRDAAQMELIETDGQRVLEPIGSTGGGLQALKIRRDRGSNSGFFWVEFRQPTDAFEATLFKGEAAGASYYPNLDPNTAMPVRDAQGRRTFRKPETRGLLDASRAGASVYFDYFARDGRDDLYLLDMTPGTAKRVPVGNDWTAPIGENGERGVWEDLKDGQLVGEWRDPVSGLVLRAQPAGGKLHVTVTYPREAATVVARETSPVMIEFGAGSPNVYQEFMITARRLRRVEDRQDLDQGLAGFPFDLELEEPSGKVTRHRRVSGPNGRLSFRIEHMDDAPLGDYKLRVAAAEDLQVRGASSYRFTGITGPRYRNNPADVQIGTPSRSTRPEPSVRPVPSSRPRPSDRPRPSPTPAPSTEPGSSPSQPSEPVKKCPWWAKHTVGCKAFRSMFGE